MQHLRQIFQKVFKAQGFGLVAIILLIGVVLTYRAETHVDRRTGEEINKFLNPKTLMQMATDTSFFAIMAVGATIVIIAGGIDLSVGSIYALAGVLTAMLLRRVGGDGAEGVVVLGLASCLGIGLLAGLINGLMVVGLKVHPFIITLGTMWIFRGIAFVSSQAMSIGLPEPVTALIKANLGLGGRLYPVPMLVMVGVTVLGAIFLSRTVPGRNIYAIGGNIDACRYAGIPISRTLVGVYAISGLCAGLAAFVGSGFYGSATCSDAQGYELYVVASAVVGGASLAGGRGSAISAALGALLIILIRQAINILKWDNNYQWIIIGCAIIVAVVLDRLGTAMAARRMKGTRSTL